MKPEAKANRELDALLAAAAAAPFDQDERALDAVLAAFNAAGADGDAETETKTEGSTVGGAGRTTGRGRVRAVRLPWLPGRLVTQCTAILVVITGGSVAMASAGVLPRPVQQFAHFVLGRVGVPAPRKNDVAPTGSPTPSTAPSQLPSPSASASPTAGAPSATPQAAAASLSALCTQVVQTNGNQWRKILSAADQATLVAAAGKQNKVAAFCADLLAGPAAGAATSPAVGPSASPSATKTHGKGHPKPTPSPKSK